MLGLLVQPYKELQLDLKTTSKTVKKIELYGSPTTKDLKKPHSPTRVGGAESQRQVERHGDVVLCREAVVEWAVPHSHVVGENQDGYLEREQSHSQAKPHSPGFQCREDISL